MPMVVVIGAGLAGCEAALQCARRGVGVRLFEMRPRTMTAAHQTGAVAELVCSNSLKSDEPDNAHGLLKAELRSFGSVLLECAERARIPGGKALVVDRGRFSAEVEAALSRAGIEVVRQEVTTLTSSLTIVATGPLTSEPLAQELTRVLGADRLFFYDAIAPIVDAESLDRTRVFAAARYQAGEDYLNCPLTEEEYDRLVTELTRAELHSLHEFEQASVCPNGVTGSRAATSGSSVNRLEGQVAPKERGLGQSLFFEPCLPVEELARRGRLALAFGPMKPVGLTDPKTGRRPFAVVQLRKENEAGTMFNLVGFQTRLRRKEQERVFRLIPGLEHAVFLRYGSIHRNTFLDSPRVLLPTLQTRVRDDLFIAGQLTGVEGYVESIASGLVAGVNAARKALGKEPLIFPAETMLGSLLRYITTPNPDFQPMNANFGLLPVLVTRVRGREKRRGLAQRSLEAAHSFAELALAVT